MHALWGWILFTEYLIRDFRATKHSGIFNVNIPQITTDIPITNSFDSYQMLMYRATAVPERTTGGNLFCLIECIRCDLSELSIDQREKGRGSDKPQLTNGELWMSLRSAIFIKIDRSTQSFTPEALDGRLSTGRIAYEKATQDNSNPG